MEFILQFAIVPPVPVLVAAEFDWNICFRCRNGSLVSVTSCAAGCRWLVRLVMRAVAAEIGAGMWTSGGAVPSPPTDAVDGERHSGRMADGDVDADEPDAGLADW